MSRVHTTGVHPQCTCGGILRGTGNQKAGAIINAVGYYVLGLPIGISLMFAAGLGLLGKPPRPEQEEPGSRPGRWLSELGDRF